MNAEMTLDEAWAAAEAALPDDGSIHRVERAARGDWIAVAHATSGAVIGGAAIPRWSKDGHGPTPSDALFHLAARLQEQPR